MSQLPNFDNDAFLSYICHLCKVLYGLNQDTHVLYIELTTHRFSLGFMKSKSNSSHLIHHCTATLIYILICVENIIIACSNLTMINKVVTSLALRFAIKDLSTLTFLVLKSCDAQIISSCLNCII